MANLFSYLGDLAGGFLGHDSAKIQEQAARLEAGQAKLRATQIAATGKQNLQTTLGAISAIRAGRGLSGDSQTGQQIERTTIQDSYAAMARARLAELNRAAAATMAAQGYDMQARWAIPMSILKMGGDMLDAAGQVVTGGAPAPGG